MFLGSVGLNFMVETFWPVPMNTWLAVNMQAPENVGDGIPPAFMLCSVGSGAKVLVHF